jgi:hypothetical protein
MTKLIRDEKKATKIYNRTHWRNKRKPKVKSAQAELTKAIKEGRVIPGPCVVCRWIETHGHHFSYSPKKRLKVTWLCASHHQSVSQYLKKGVPLTQVVRWWKLYQKSINAPTREWLFIVRNRKLLAKRKREANNKPSL